LLCSDAFVSVVAGTPGSSEDAFRRMLDATISVLR